MTDADNTPPRASASDPAATSHSLLDRVKAGEEEVKAPQIPELLRLARLAGKKGKLTGEQLFKLMMPSRPAAARRRPSPAQRRIWPSQP